MTAIVAEKKLIAVNYDYRPGQRVEHILGTPKNGVHEIDIGDIKRVLLDEFATEYRTGGYVTPIELLKKIQDRFKRPVDACVAETLEQRENRVLIPPSWRYGPTLFLGSTYRDTRNQRWFKKLEYASQGRYWYIAKVSENQGLDRYTSVAIWKG